MTALPPDVAADLRRRITELEQKLQSSSAERDEAIAQQAAAAEVLQVIKASKGSLAPVFDAILEKAMHLCEAAFGVLSTYDGNRFESVAMRGVPAAYAEFRQQGSQTYGPGTAPARALAGERVIHILDLKTEDAYRNGEANRRAIVDLGGARSALLVTLLKNDAVLGIIMIYRQEVRPFSDKLVALLQNFADQAVIAIENARLFNETKEALARQTATSEILRVISQSPTDVRPVFDAIVLTAVRLLRCDMAFVLRCDGATYSPAAVATPEGLLAELGPANLPVDPGANFPSRAIAGKKMLHLPDWSLVDLPEHERRIHEMYGVNSALYLPLLRGEECIGLLALAGKQANIFGDSEIALAESFRDQAVIAIENVRLFNETREALERQTATADILKVIASSPSDVQPVFDVIVERAVRLCGGRMGRVYRYDGDVIQMVAAHGLSAPGLNKVQQVFPRSATDDTIAGKVMLSRQPYFVSDIKYDESVPALSRQMIEAMGTRSQVTVPMLRNGESIGAITVGWAEPGAYQDQQVTLLQTFADQAVIAIENVRLFNETKEALERQTATADILKVIASSPSDVQPVFEAIATSSNRLIGGFSTAVLRFVGDELHLAAFTPTNAVADEALKASFPRPLAEFPPFELVRNGETVQFVDTESEDVPPLIRNLARLRGYRSMLFTPLMSDGAPIGLISVTRVEPGSFAAHHVQLLRTFADQAVIAIENVRLFDEVQAKTRDLTESLQQQTATADVLKVISRSAFDLQTVLDTLTESAARLCNADMAAIARQDAGGYYHATNYNFSVDWVKVTDPLRLQPGSGSVVGRALLAGTAVQIPDVLADPDYAYPDMQKVAGYRTLLGVPLLRGKEPIGVLFLGHKTVEPFTEKQVELVSTFADQAVIAIENVRLFDEVQAKTRDLTESLQQQTATADVLKVISRSAFDLDTVLATLISTAVRLCNCGGGQIFRREGDVYRYAASQMNVDPAYRRHEQGVEIRAGRGTLIGRVALLKRAVMIPDAWSDPEYEEKDAARTGNVRAMLGVPLLRGGEPIGAFALARSEPTAFTEREIELVTSFADQAVIAIENVRLFNEVQARTNELAASLDELRTAQDRLVQTEKLASLGQLTAGIAHEIKNPLNFVNNFSALSAELTDELNDVLKSAVLSDKIREEVDELTGMLKDNLQKVVQHGKRADSIVKNMLLHSREGTGEHRPADINAILDESLNLAYHGARAEKREFNVTLQRDFDDLAGTIELFPQEITRVFLNLISNGFYAVTKRKMENGGSGFEPVIRATTRNLGDTVEIRIRDNGTGIPPEVKEKMFNPFFTTKPAGEGTGLGLSMSHDIIVKQHGGSIDVETEPGQFTEFRIVLPRTSNFSDKDRGQT